MSTPSDPNSYLDLVMSGALSRVIFRLNRGDSASDVLAFLQTHYARFSLGDLSTLLEVSQQAIAAAKQLVKVPGETKLSALAAPPLPTVAPGMVEIDTVAKGFSPRGSRPVFQYVQAQLEKERSVVDWLQVLETMANLSNSPLPSEEDSELEAIPQAMFSGGVA